MNLVNKMTKNKKIEKTEVKTKTLDAKKVSEAFDSILKDFTSDEATVVYLQGKVNEAKKQAGL